MSLDVSIPPPARSERRDCSLSSFASTRAEDRIEVDPRRNGMELNGSTVETGDMKGDSSSSTWNSPAAGTEGGPEGEATCTPFSLHRASRVATARATALAMTCVLAACVGIFEFVLVVWLVAACKSAVGVGGWHGGEREGGR